MTVSHSPNSGGADVVARAKAALEGITEGPWEQEVDGDGQPIEHEQFHYDSSDTWFDVDGPNGGWVAHCQDEADQRFVAAARSLIPELVAEVARLTGWLEFWESGWQPESLQSENAGLRATIERVREIHANTASQVHGNWCAQCHTYWPCATIAALDGTERLSVGEGGSS